MLGPYWSEEGLPVRDSHFSLATSCPGLGPTAQHLGLAKEEDTRQAGLSQQLLVEPWWLHSVEMGGWVCSSFHP